MTTFLKALLAAITAAVAIALALVLYGAVTFIEERVSTGTAYGFTIGDTPEEVYRKAAEMREAGDIAEIKRGQGSAAIRLDDRSLDPALRDDSWTIVYDPDWWNDTATLYFESGTLKQIYRVRVCCELP